MEPIMTANTVISSINIIALGIISGVFIMIYIKTRAQLPLGMIFVSGLLLIHNIIGVYGYVSMTELYAPILLPYLFGVNIAELAGVLILLKITLQ
ncbi:MAG: hypothetical protein ACREA5_06355 [Nitrosotalea sp.]